MMCEDMYFMCKTVVVELIQPMEDPEFFSLHIAVLLLSTR